MSQAVTNHDVYESVTMPPPLWLEPWALSKAMDVSTYVSQFHFSVYQNRGCLVMRLYFILHGAAEKDIALHGEGQFDVQPRYHLCLGTSGSPGSSRHTYLLMANVPQCSLRAYIVPCVHHESG